MELFPIASQEILSQTQFLSYKTIFDVECISKLLYLILLKHFKNG